VKIQDPVLSGLESSWESEPLSSVHASKLPESGTDGVENWSDSKKYSYKNGDRIRFSDGFVYERKNAQWVRIQNAAPSQPGQSVGQGSPSVTSPSKPLIQDQDPVENWNDQKKYSYQNGDRVRFSDGLVYVRVSGAWQRETDLQGFPQTGTTPPSNVGEAQPGIMPPYSLHNQSAISLKDIRPIMYEKSRAVGRIEVPGNDTHVGAGTGFLVKGKDGNSYVLTNYHVISRENHIPGESNFLLGYETEPKSSSTVVRLGRIIVENKNLDYTLVEVLPEDAQKAEPFGFLAFASTSGTGEAIYLPNHAGNYPKGISFLDREGAPAVGASYNSDLGSQAINQSFYHTAFADPGSSGSPVISRKTNKVIGLNYGKIGDHGNAVDTKNVEPSLFLDVDRLRTSVEEDMGHLRTEGKDVSGLKILKDILDGH
jgi:trypsin-like peptidase